MLFQTPVLLRPEHIVAPEYSLQPERSGIILSFQRTKLKHMKALKITGIILLVIVAGMLATATYVKTALPNVGPPPDITIERTAERVERGQYLANHVAVCMDCHSSRNWGQYAGPMVPGNLGGGGEVFSKEMGFPGTFYAPNITPYALASWTDGEIVRAITTGVSKNGRALFPVMAYHRFGRMDQEDVYSIVAYLRTLPPVEKTIPASEAMFPVSILINTMPAPAAFTQKPDTGNQVAYGQYLMNATGCVDCHSQTDKGKVIPGTEFGGGMEFNQPGGVVRAPNITMHPETGIGSWTKETFVQRFKMYADSSYVPATIEPGKLNTPMPWSMFAGMKEQDLEALYAYLRSIAPIDHQVLKFEYTKQP
jgi:mono/diheme cytochrome c family protein